MELRFKKEELSFLFLYSLCSDTKTRESNLFQILSIQGTSDIIFLQYSKMIIFITTFKDKNKSKEGILLTYESPQFSDILKYCAEDSEVIISNKGISFGEHSKYTFESINISPVFSEASLSDMLKVINNKGNYENIEFLDFDKIASIKAYAGNDLQGLNFIGIYDNHYVISNKVDGTGVIKSKNKFSKNYFLSLMTYNIFHFLKIASLSLKNITDNNLFLLDYGNINMFFVKNTEQLKVESGKEDELLLPNIINDINKIYYYHDAFIKIDKKDILNSLQKISTVANSKQGNRVFFSFSSDKISIETKEGSQGLEEIPYSCPSKLFNVVIALSINFTISMISSVPGDIVVIRFPYEKDNINAISIMDEEESTMFIQTVLTDSYTV